ncbi:mitochondrial ribonuclease P catalytic subunit [Onthophagus taurus]|uniref:mitochondrial ribonuclease P catalytic subunit n=1 Tax=Onthophagus taurus TaxID=166361 RepID=UPI000C20684C|nr:mitochondrial ribonuclease P protein 3 [Onthophagus taurus]
MFRKCFNKLSTKIIRNFHAKPKRFERDFPPAKNILAETINGNKINKTSDWKIIRNQLLENKIVYNEKSIDSILLNHCIATKKYDYAKKYIEFLHEENIKMNLGSLGKYLKMYYSMYYDGLMHEKDEEKILQIYEDILKEYPVLDSITLENLICALSVTTSWKKSKDLLTQCKLTTIPTNNSYNSLTTSAFRNEDPELGWELFNEMIINNRSPQNITYESILNELKINASQSIFIAKLEKFFEVLDNHDLQFDKEIAALLFNILKQSKVKGIVSKITYQGICVKCKIKLDETKLTNNEFNDLKVAFLNEVVVGKNVFCKTTPEELDRFKSFIKNMGQFDVVIDGLNTQYSQGVAQSPQVTAALLSEVVNHFKKQGKEILLLGRNHMERLPTKNWSFIKRNCMIFLTQDISQDDPFILYCALHSGNDTKIVTRDLMRSHLFLLKDKRLKKLFKRWLIQNRLHLITAKPGTVIFKQPLKYMITPQKNENTWHVPYIEEIKENPKSIKYEWLCIDLNKFN